LGLTANPHLQIHNVSHRFFIMKKTLELIEEKKEKYREFRRQLGHESTTAKRLGFDTEVQKIQNDRKWAMEIIDLLQEVAVKVQGESNGG